MSDLVDAEPWIDLGGVAPKTPAIGAEDALLLAMRLQHLRRARFLPGHPHKRFIRDISHVKPEAMTEAQRAHVTRLAWRYRLQLPRDIRPACNPDPKPISEAI